MVTFIAVLLFLLAISILVIFHEFGHFITAKLFGMRAEKFYLFMNPGLSLFRMKKFNGKWHFKFLSPNTKRSVRTKKDEEGNAIFEDTELSWFDRVVMKKQPERKEVEELIPLEELEDDDWSKYPEITEYGIGWLPFGGFVKIAGMIDESIDKQQLKQAPNSWEFRAKPAWQRFIVITAGVIMNLIIGIVIFSFSHLIFTKHYTPIENIKEGIYAYPYANYLGFENGDLITAIDGKKVERAEDVCMNGKLSYEFILSKEVTVLRNGVLKNIEIPDTLLSFYKTGNPIIGFDIYPVVVDTVLPFYRVKKEGQKHIDTIISSAYISGLKAKAEILYINGEKIYNFGHFKETLLFNKEKDIQLIAKQNNRIDTLTVFVGSDGKIGISQKYPDYEQKNYTFLSSIKFGNKDAIGSMMANIKGFGKIASGQMSARESLSGPLGILLIFKDGVKDDLTIIWEFFWKLTAIFSMALAFMNILPIPALDGGHALFILIEIIIRRPLPEKFLIYIQYLGMLLLLALMVFATWNDIMKIFMK